MKFRAPARLAVSAALALSAAAGMTAATAPAASAASATVGASACTEKIKLDTTVNAAVRFHTGPGTSYTATGQLNKGTGVYWSCNKGSAGSSKSWGYVKVYTGAHKGQWGWVSRPYIDTPMQTD
ncbi:SH3 domain-containing protein [Streptomyces sp. NPDC014006]|uniref:SH3 domain-containing protein n=1 Tax=Streptomyces sp. NPDC014006 TaxID=3364870 RepID=UPI00370294D4